MNCTGRSLLFTIAREPFGVAEDQVAALVGGEATGEADGQRVGIEDLLGPVHFRRAATRAA